jgi:hypothetical protein
MVMMRPIAPVCFVVGAFRRGSETGLWCSPWVRVGCNDGCKDNGDNCETHFLMMEYRSMNQVVAVMKSQDRELWMRDPATFERFSWRHAAHLIVYRSIRKSSTRLNMN